MIFRPVKPFLTIEQQIDNLQNNKNLIILDCEKAYNTLKSIRYFSLIDGYKDLFYNMGIETKEEYLKRIIDAGYVTEEIANQIFDN